MTRPPAEQAPACELVDHPSVHIARTAKTLYGPWCQDWPEQMSALHGHTDAYYQKTGLWATNPVQARYRVARSLHQAAIAPLIHYVEIERASAMLPNIENDETLGKESIPFSLIQESQLSIDMNESYHHVWQRESAWGSGASERVLQQIEADPSHPLRPSWEAFCAILPEFSAAESQVRWFQRTQDPRESFAANNVETFVTLMATMMPRALQLNRLKGLSGAALASRLLAESEQLAWASSVTRDFGIDKLPIPKSCLPFTEQPVFNHPDIPQIWDLASLADGPWKVLRYCPANLDLEANNQAAREVTDRLYAAKERLSGHFERTFARPSGVSTAAELRVITLLFLLAETVFIESPF